MKFVVVLLFFRMYHEIKATHQKKRTVSAHLSRHRSLIAGPIGTLTIAAAHDRIDRSDQSPGVLGGSFEGLFEGLFSVRPTLLNFLIMKETRNCHTRSQACLGVVSKGFLKAYVPSGPPL